MTEIPSEAASNDDVNKLDFVNAKKKRMLLSEVYVHKTRKVQTDSDKDDEFDVFHIFEFADDPNTKVTPKLSTNCTEPRKIIDVLQNSTGSDTPQLQRLIEKLCAQNKKWSDAHQNQTNRATTRNSSANDAAVNKTAPTPTSRCEPKIEAPPPVMQISAIQKAPTATAKTVTPPTVTIPSVPKMTVLLPTLSKPKSVAPVADKVPAIRVKTIESLKEIEKDHKYSSPLKPVAKKRVSLSSIQASEKPATFKTPKAIERPSSVVERQPPGGPTATRPIKPMLWNNVMPKSAPAEPLQVKVVTMNKSSESNGSTFPLKSTQNIVRQYAASEKRMAEKNSTEKTASIEQNPMLRIDQVYGSVNDDFVDDLLGDKTSRKQSLSDESPSPLLDTLVETAGHDKNTDQFKVSIIQKADANCSDYRCNICLDFNETFAEYKQHMGNKHGLDYVCEKCHGGFTSSASFFGHFTSPASSGGCTLSMNNQRSFICIVDPPNILMKNDKVYAFRCKHCELAFQNQRNYVQHAQRHAQLFRCKKCPTKPLPVHLMRQHLNHHVD